MRRLILILLLLFPLTACSAVVGSGNVVTEERSISDFDKIFMVGTGELEVQQGDRVTLSVTAEDNLMPLVESVVRGDTLYLGPKAGAGFTANAPIRFKLTARSVNGIEASDNTQILTGPLSTETLSLASSGNSRVAIESLTADLLQIESSGRSNLTLAGEVETQIVELTDSAEYAAAELNSQVADVSVSGSSTASVWVNQELFARAGGTGSITYYGDPTVTSDTRDAGSVASRGGR